MWSPPPDVAAPPPAACAAAIRGVEGAPSAAAVPAGCWRVGPLVIGMTPAQVEAEIGPPGERFGFTSDGASPRRYTAAAYVFPRDLAAQLSRRPQRSLPTLRTLGLLYREGRLVRIDTSPGFTVASARCPNGGLPPPDLSRTGAPPRDFAPFTRFATLRVGEPITRAADRLGRDYTVSTAGDFRAFRPAPVTLDGDVRLGGFSVSADEASEFEGFAPRLILERRAGGCRIDGFRFDPPER